MLVTKGITAFAVVDMVVQDKNNLTSYLKLSAVCERVFAIFFFDVWLNQRVLYINVEKKCSNISDISQ